jgi:phosphate transport system protein
MKDEHTRRVLRQPMELAFRECEEHALAELELVRKLLRQAVNSIESADATLAEISALADEAKQRYSTLHDRLLALIARQAPVAGDLRLAMALLHTNDRVERMAAQCVNIATLSTAFADGVTPSPSQLECVTEMAELADRQIADTIQVFAERSADGARRLYEQDLSINELNRSCFRRGLADSREDDEREAAFLVAMMARAIERIGDNAVDIGQQAVFAETGALRAITGAPRES